MALVSGWRTATCDDIDVVACITARNKGVNQQQYCIEEVLLCINTYQSCCHKFVMESQCAVV